MVTKIETETHLDVVYDIHRQQRRLSAAKQLVQTIEVSVRRTAAAYVLFSLSTRQFLMNVYKNGMRDTSSRPLQ